MKRQFSKDGHVTVATSSAQAVRLAFDGWRESPPEPQPEPEASAEPDVPEDQPTPPRKRTSNR